MAVTRVSKSSISDYNKSNLMSGGRGLGSGGDYTGDANGFRYHIFTSSGTFTATSSGAVEYLVIGGGGAGGYRTSAANIACGGGGAGGVLRGATALSAGDYTVTIGAGGVATDDTPTSGTDTSFGSIATAFGGGGGGTQSASNNALSGASGGGGASNSVNLQYAEGAQPKGLISGTGLYDGVGEQGHAGGAGESDTAGKGGGGGGVGSAGHSGLGDGTWESRTTSEFWGRRCNGGFGVRHDDFGADATTIAGTAIGEAYSYTPDAGGTAIAYLFGGGGAGGDDDTTDQRLGGPGGGGNGGSTNTPGDAGTDFTGGGGGGGANNQDGGDGGAGIVILRYAI